MALPAEMAMPRTSIRAARRQRGFTLIELGVVTFILLLLAALAAPNFLQMEEGQRARSSVAALSRLAIQARETAIVHQTTTKLTYDDAGGQIVLKEERQDEDDATVASVNLAGGVQARDFRLNGNSSSAGDWELRFYADGKSDEGGVSVDDAGRIWSLTVDKYGIAKLQEGDLPDESQTRWQAGDYEHRQ